MFQRSRRKLIIPFIAPQFILYVTFVFLPLDATIFYGLTDWQGHGNPWHWYGIQNFRILWHDTNFHKAARNAAYLMVVGGIIVFVPAMLIAWMLQQPIRMHRFFQFIILSPLVIAASVAGLMWKWMYNPTQGLINPALKGLGLDALAKPWLGDPKYALTAIIIASVWHGLGTWVLLISAGIDQIPADLPDAAKTDGSSDWQVFIFITLPLLWEVLRILLVLWIIQALQAFTFIFVMTGPYGVGGPLSSTEVMGTYVYKMSFTDFKWGYASALATSMLIGIFILSVLVNRLTFREQIEY
jgi:ABC-type sugar transport system permease subunit